MSEATQAVQVERSKERLGQLLEYWLAVYSCSCGRAFATEGSMSNPNHHAVNCEFVVACSTIAGQLRESESNA